MLFLLLLLMSMVVFPLVFLIFAIIRAAVEGDFLFALVGTGFLTFGFFVKYLSSGHWLLFFGGKPMSKTLANSHSSQKAAGHRQVGMLLQRGVSLEDMPSVSPENAPGYVVLQTAVRATNGHTIATLFLHPKDFRDVIDKMIETDPKAVIALSRALANELERRENEED